MFTSFATLWAALLILNATISAPLPLSFFHAIFRYQRANVDSEVFSGPPDISRRPERSDRRVERGSVVGITGFVMNPSLIVIGYLPLNDGRGRRLGHFGSFSVGAKKRGR